MSEDKKLIEVTEIMKLIPHRYPMLLIDRLVDYKENDYVVGLKNVTFNEPHFMGHFPDAPIMPGVLIVEAMAQAAGALIVHSLNIDSSKKLVYFMTIDNARFRKPVIPGDSLYIHAQMIKARGMIWKFKGEAKVNDKLVAEATYSAMIVDRENAP